MGPRYASVSHRMSLQATPTREIPRLTKGQRRMLIRVIDYPSSNARPYRPRGRFTKLTAKRLVERHLLVPTGDHYRALYDPRTRSWAS